MTLTKEEFISHLVTKANSTNNTEVLAVLKEYRANVDTQINCDKLKAKPKVAELKETIYFLYGTTAEDDPNFKADIEKKVKVGLVNKVVSRIEALQPETCKACSKDYYFEVTDSPHLKCKCCLRGACPECYSKDEEMYNKLSMRGNGIYYLCGSCCEGVEYKEDQQDKRTGGRKAARGMDLQVAATPSGVNGGGEPARGLEAEAPKSGAEKPGDKSDTESDTEDSDGGDFEETREQKRKKKKEEKRAAKEEQKEKCKFFLRNKCKYGVSGEKCPFFHPRRCSKWMKAGKEGCKKCDLFHPAICYGSINHKKCEKAVCTYIHLPGTVRIKPTEDGDRKKAFPAAGGPRQEKLDCIMCPCVFKSEKELTHHINTAHSHKCHLCGGEFSYREELAEHNCQVHKKRMGEGLSGACPSAGGSNKPFLAEQPQDVEGQKEILNSVNNTLEMMMKQNQIQNQNMMNMFQQMLQQQQQPRVVAPPPGWRMPGM